MVPFTQIQPLFEAGYIRVPNELCDFLPIYPFTSRQRRIFDVIYRQTIGYRKTWDDITIPLLARLTRIDRRDVRRTLNDMVSDGIVREEEGRYGRKLSLNLNFESWGRFTDIIEDWEWLRNHRMPKSKGGVSPSGSGDSPPSGGERGGESPPHNTQSKITKNTHNTNSAVLVQSSECPTVPVETQCVSGGGVSDSQKKEDYTPPIQLSIPSVLSGIKSAVFKLIRGISQTDAQHLLDEAAAQVEAHEQQNIPIKNIGGYLAALIRRFRNGEFTPGIVAQRKAEEEAARQKEEAIRQAKEAEERKEAEKKAASEERELKIQAVISKLSELDLAEMKDRYINHLRDENNFLFRHFNSSNFSSAMFIPLMHTFIYESITGESLSTES